MAWMCSLCFGPLRAAETDADSLRTACHMALKSNLLYDAALVPNLGGVVNFGPYYLELDGHYTRIRSRARHRQWCTYGADLTMGRYWGRSAAEGPLRGHHVGLYGQLLAYDFEFGGRGYQGRRWSYGGGLEYGYAWALSRHFRLDTSLGFGYLTGRYEEYVPEDNCRVWVATKNRQWLGPTRAEVAFVWLLF